VRDVSCITHTGEMARVRVDMRNSGLRLWKGGGNEDNYGETVRHQS